LTQPDRFSTRVFGLAVVAVLAYLLFQIFSPFFAPIYWAFLLAFMLFPVNRRLRRAWGGRRARAAALITVGVMLGIAAPVAIGVMVFARQAIELSQVLSRLAQRYQIDGIEDIMKFPVIGTATEWLQKTFRVEPAQIQAWAVGSAQSAVQFLLSHGRDLLFGAFGIFGNLILMLFILFFFLRDGDQMASRVKGLIPLDPKRKDRLSNHLQDVTRAVVFGTVVTALVQGALLGVGLWITGVPSPLVFGVLAAVASFIPFVGTGLVWVPAAIYLFAQGVAWKTVFFVIWSVLVVGSADNVLRPMLVSGKAAMGTLTVFFGVLGGLAAFGFIGLFLGPVILALVLTLIGFVEEGDAPPASGGP
jgi:predicted PurR-regulated permease PerM